MKIDIEISKTEAGTDRIRALKKGTSIGRLYIKPNGLICRLHVSDKYRQQGVATKMFQALIDNFSNRNLYGYVSPNRIKGLNESNKEEYKQILFTFYKKFNFEKVGDANKIVYVRK